MPEANVTRFGRHIIFKLKRVLLNTFRTPATLILCEYNFFIQPFIWIQNCFYDQNNLWNLIDKCLDPIVANIEFCASNYGPTLFVSIVIILLLFVTVAYCIGLPFWLIRNRCIAVSALLLGNLILSNVIYQMITTRSKGPGFVDHDQVSWKETASECRRCKGLRPARAHHCRICDRCVLRMDHHCPWLNVCIGLTNYKHFILFCIYTWLGALFVAIFGLPILIEYWFNYSLFPGETPESWLFKWKSLIWKRLVFFEASICVIVLVAVGLFICLHIYLISKGETTIERLMHRRQFVNTNHSYQSIDIKQNWLEFLDAKYSNFKIWHLIWPINYLFKKQ